MIVALAWCGPYRDLNRKLELSTSSKDALSIVLASHAEDPTITEISHRLQSGQREEKKMALSDLKAYVATRAAAESYAQVPNVKSQIAEIKKNPFYRDERVHSANWFGNAVKNVWDRISNLFNWNFKEPDSKGLKEPQILGNWIIWVVWVILFCLAGTFGYFALRQFRWKSLLKRKAKALLDEEEPERTLDEWLERASFLESQGQYREAVRCLYLACLLRFDEARIARFERAETNWEHLRRIQESPKRPPQLNFEPTTRAFDDIWYGMRTEGKPDVDRFRGWYGDVTSQVAVG